MCALAKLKTMAGLKALILDAYLLFIYTLETVLNFYVEGL